MLQERLRMLRDPLVIIVLAEGKVKKDTDVKCLSCQSEDCCFNEYVDCVRLTAQDERK